MISFIEQRRSTLTYRIISAFVAITFIFSSVVPPTPIYAQALPQSLLNLPLPGTMVSLTPGFNPPLVKGITIHPDNPLKFDFLVSPGDDNLEGAEFRTKSKTLIKYFLAGLTVPDNELWVNLSPYEEDRIVSKNFGQTEMGRDMLAQDYILKQLTASLMYPEDELGKKFWDRVYTRAYEEYGTTEIPMNTFNKIWIVPEKAVVYEHEQTAFVVESHLKVMLEEDYVALNNHIGETQFGLDSVEQDEAEVISGVSSAVVREILIPEIEKEVNTGEIFTQLRQIYNSVILASWYKDNLKQSLLGQVYVDQAKVKGVDHNEGQVNQKIYERYVEAFKTGVYNYIKEDYDPATDQIIPRKYFSGGFNVGTTRGLRVDVRKVTPLQGSQAAYPVQSVAVDLVEATGRFDDLEARYLALLENGFNVDESKLYELLNLIEERIDQIVEEFGENILALGEDFEQDQLDDLDADLGQELRRLQARQSLIIGMLVELQPQTVQESDSEFYEEEAAASPVNREVLRDEAVKATYDYVPGIRRRAKSKEDLAQASKQPQLVVDGTLEILEGAGLVKKNRTGEFHRTAAASPINYRLQNRVLAQVPKSYTERDHVIARKVGVSLSETKRHLRDLVRAGKVEQPSSGLFRRTASSPITAELEHRDYVPQHRDSPPEDLFFKQYEKVEPLVYSFLRAYGGKSSTYRLLKGLGNDLKRKTNLSISNETTDPYVDIFPATNSEKQKIVLNKDFVDFLNKSGLKKVFMALMAGSLLKARKGIDADTHNVEVLVTGQKTSLVDSEGSLLSDIKRLYQLQKIVENNDTEEGVQSPYYLTDNDIMVVISNLLHRGKILDARRLWETLRETYGAYGEISREKAEQLLERFQNEHQNAIEQREVVVTDNIEKWKAKLDDEAKIVNEGIAAGDKSKIVKVYNLRGKYQEDPAFKNRWFIWDVEVEKIDEVFVGGKSANTGEMMHSQHTVPLPSFFSNGIGFQRLYEYNTTERYLPHLRSRIEELDKFIRAHWQELEVNIQDVDKDTQVRLGELGVNLDDLDTHTPKALDQATEALSGMRTVLENFERSGYANLREYFTTIGDALDEEILRIKAEQDDNNVQISILKAGIKQHKDDPEMTDDIKRWRDQIQGFEKENVNLRKAVEERASKDSSRLLAAARIMLVPNDFKEEMKDHLRSLANRLNIPIQDLMLAIRSSMAGEDSEEASFAGRQDSNFFRRPFATENDPEGLEFIVRELVFNQASLFNKRSITYRLGLPTPLPTFDKDVRISTVVQDMFMTEIASTTFSVDRNSGYPIMDVQLTEGQGDIMVSGSETGGTIKATYDGVILERQKGQRNKMFLEKRDADGRIVGRMTLNIPDDVKSEHAITDQELIRKSVQYFNFLHDFYSPGYVDLEGAWRRKEDVNGDPVPLLDTDGETQLLDERGKPRWQWQIVSTQARPETVHTGRDSDVVPLKKITVTKKAYDKAVRENRVLPLKFLAQINGTAQGKATWVLDKTSDSLAKTSGKIMLTEQSDPDMNDAMIAAKGVIAVNGGGNSHTMVVGSEYDLVVMTGLIKNTMRELQELIPEGTEITMDTIRGVVLLGVDHELEVIGDDFNVRELERPVIPYNEHAPGMRSADVTRTSTIVGSNAKAFVQWAMSRIPNYKGIGLERLEIALAAIGIYPEALLAYDNLLKIESGETRREVDGPILSRENDAELIEKIRLHIEGYSSGQDFYVDVLSEWLQATTETLIAPKVEVVVRAQKISDPELRLKVLRLVLQNYEIGLGHEEPLNEIKRILNERIGPERLYKEGSDDELIHEIIGLMDKRTYIRLDDRKSDEYGAVLGANKFVRDEINPMKGWRGIGLMLDNPITLRWQLAAIHRVASKRRSKIGVFAPIVRRIEEKDKFLEMMDEAGLTRDLVKRGIMTELPTNAINIIEFLVGLDFISTGGNDLLQTLGGIDRLTSVEDVESAVNAYSLSVLRANAMLAAAVKEYNRINDEKCEAGYCGNDPSKKGQENYGAILGLFGYDSVSVILEAFERFANLLAKTNPEISQEIRDIIGFNFEIDPNAVSDSVEKINYKQLNIASLRLDLPVHYRALQDYRALQEKVSESGVESLGEKERAIYYSVRSALETAGYGARINNPDIAQIYYREYLESKIEEAAQRAETQGKQLVVGTDDGLSGSYKNLSLGEHYETVEANQDFGFTGIIRAVGKNKVDEEIFRTDLEIIRTVNTKVGNISIALKKVRSPQELSDGMDLVKSIAPSIPVGVDFYVPGNVFEAQELTEQEGISFTSIADPIGFTSGLFALEQNNHNGVEITEADVQFQLNRPIAVLATQAKKKGIPMYVKSTRPTLAIMNGVAAASPIQVIEPQNVPESFASILRDFGLHVQDVSITPLEGEFDVQEVLRDPDHEFAIATAMAQAYGTIFYAGENQKDIADGVAVHLSERSIHDYTQRNTNTAVVTLASEGKSDASFYQKVGRIDYAGFDNGFWEPEDEKVLDEAYAKIEELRAAGVEIKFILSDGLENTNAQAKNKLDASALFGVIKDSGVTPRFIDDNMRIVSTNWNGPSADVHPLDPPSVSFPKIAIAQFAALSGIPVNEVNTNSPAFIDFLERFISHTRFSALGPRDPSQAKDKMTSGDKRHLGLIEDAQTTYPGIATHLPGDGNFTPRLDASVIPNLDGESGLNTIVTDRGKTAELYMAYIAAVLRREAGAQMNWMFASVQETSREASQATVGNFNESDNKMFRRLGYTVEEQRSVHTVDDVDFDGIVVQTSVTGASEEGFGREFPKLMRRISENSDGTSDVNSLVITNQGTFVLHVTFITSDMEETKTKLRRATVEAIIALDNETSSPVSAETKAEIEQFSRSVAEKVNELRAAASPLETTENRYTVIPNATRVENTADQIVLALSKRAQGGKFLSITSFKEWLNTALETFLSSNGLIIPDSKFPEFRQKSTTSDRVTVAVNSVDYDIAKFTYDFGEQEKADGLALVSYPKVDTPIKDVKMFKEGLIAAIAAGNSVMTENRARAIVDDYFEHERHGLSIIGWLSDMPEVDVLTESVKTRFIEILLREQPDWAVIIPARRDAFASTAFDDIMQGYGEGSSPITGDEEAIKALGLITEEVFNVSATIDAAFSFLLDDDGDTETTKMAQGLLASLVITIEGYRKRINSQVIPAKIGELLQQIEGKVIRLSESISDMDDIEDFYRQLKRDTAEIEGQIERMLDSIQTNIEQRIISVPAAINEELKKRFWEFGSTGDAREWFENTLPTILERIGLEVSNIELEPGTIPPTRNRTEEVIIWNIKGEGIRIAEFKVSDDIERVTVVLLQESLRDAITASDPHINERVASDISDIYFLTKAGRQIAGDLGAFISRLHKVFRDLLIERQIDWPETSPSRRKDLALTARGEILSGDQAGSSPLTDYDDGLSLLRRDLAQPGEFTIEETEDPAQRARESLRRISAMLALTGEPEPGSRELKALEELERGLANMPDSGVTSSPVSTMHIGREAIEKFDELVGGPNVSLVFIDNDGETSSRTADDVRKYLYKASILRVTHNERTDETTLTIIFTGQEGYKFPQFTIGPNTQYELQMFLDKIQRLNEDPDEEIDVDFAMFVGADLWGGSVWEVYGELFSTEVLLRVIKVLAVSLEELESAKMNLAREERVPTRNALRNLRTLVEKRSDISDSQVDSSSSTEEGVSASPVTTSKEELDAARSRLEDAIAKLDLTVAELDRIPSTADYFAVERIGGETDFNELINQRKIEILKAELLQRIEEARTADGVDRISNLPKYQRAHESDDGSLATAIDLRKSVLRASGSSSPINNDPRPAPVRGHEMHTDTLPVSVSLETRIKTAVSQIKSSLHGATSTNAESARTKIRDTLRSILSDNELEFEDINLKLSPNKVTVIWKVNSRPFSIAVLHTSAKALTPGSIQIVDKALSNAISFAFSESEAASPLTRSRLYTAASVTESLANPPAFDSLDLLEEEIQRVSDSIVSIRDAAALEQGVLVRPKLEILGGRLIALEKQRERFEDTEVSSSPLSSNEVGGINLNPALLDLQIKRDGNGVPLPFNLQPAEIMNIDGFIPVIINVTPAVNLPMLLGLNLPESEENPTDSADANTAPFELGFVDKYRHKFIRDYQDSDINV